MTANTWLWPAAYRRIVGGTVADRLHSELDENEMRPHGYFSFLL